MKANALVQLQWIEYCFHSYLKNRWGLSSLMAPLLNGGRCSSTDREIKCDNEHCEWQWRGPFPSLQTLGGSRCLSRHLLPMTEETSREGGENEVGGRRATVVHLRLIKRSEARHRLWRCLIKGLKGGCGELFMPRLFFFFASMWSLEKGIKWRPRVNVEQHKSPEQLISHKAQFPRFISADGRRLFFFVSKGSHDYTAFFTMLLQPLLDFTHSAAHLPLFSVAHFNQWPQERDQTQLARVRLLKRVNKVAVQDVVYLCSFKFNLRGIQWMVFLNLPSWTKQMCSRLTAVRI